MVLLNVVLCKAAEMMGPAVHCTFSQSENSISRLRYGRSKDPLHTYRCYEKGVAGLFTRHWEPPQLTRSLLWASQGSILISKLIMTMMLLELEGLWLSRGFEGRATAETCS